MDLSNDQLIAEAILVNHARVGKQATLDEYRRSLGHFSEYLASSHGETFYTARRKHVLLFMAHLEKQGGAKPDESRLLCGWCKSRGYPDGREGCGFSPSTRKRYLAALRCLYLHFQVEEDLPDINPTSMVPAPKRVNKIGFTPTREEVKRLFEASAQPKARLLIRWTFYAPSRANTFAKALWRDIDLDRGKWEVVGKGDKVDVFDLCPALIRELRVYRKWQLKEAQRNEAMLDALGDPETAYVLMTRRGNPMTKTQIYKCLRRLGVRAGVGVRRAPSHWDSVGGLTSNVTPHAMRRAWAASALNDEKQPIDVVSEVLKHSEISTTRRHYAPTKSAHAREALLGMGVA